VFCSFAKYETQPVSKVLNVPKLSRHNQIVLTQIHNQQDRFRPVSRQQQDRFRNKLFSHLSCHIFCCLFWACFLARFFEYAVQKMRYFEYAVQKSVAVF